MRDLNEAMQTELDGVHYVTMVAAGFHGRRGLLVSSNAGHPSPFWHQVRRDEWAWFDERSRGHRDGVGGAPLGLLPGVSYQRIIVRPDPGDLFVLYSDDVSEATNPVGEEAGRDGLIAISRQLDWSNAQAFGTQLVEALCEFRGDAMGERSFMTTASGPSRCSAQTA
jgi:sigma-B regulation protein RsbU (phosphoserine phosphatase)